MASQKEGYVIPINGAAGTGKTVFSDRLVKRLNDEGMPSVKSRKRSTRDPRTLEISGFDYEHMDPKSFDRSVREGDTIAVYEHDNGRYGHPKEILKLLKEGIHVIIEGDPQGLVALHDYRTREPENLPNRIIPILLHGDYNEGINRIVDRESGSVTLAIDQIKREYEIYKEKSSWYRYVIQNPNQKIMSRDEFMFHLAGRIVDALKEEKEDGDFSPEVLREAYAHKVIGNLFQNMAFYDVMGRANSEKLSLDFEDSLLEEYERVTNVPTKKLKSVNVINAVQNRGIFSIYIVQDEECREAILDLIEMKVGLVPQYRHDWYEEYNQLHYSKLSPMSLTSTNELMNFCLSYSLFDPITLPDRTSRLHTVNIEAISRNGKKAQIDPLDETESIKVWKERDTILSSNRISYIDLHKSD